MSLLIELTAEEEAALRSRAEKSHQPVDQYVRGVLVGHLESGRSFDELLAGFRAQVEESGATDAELDLLFEEAREESYRARSSHH